MKRQLGENLKNKYSDSSLLFRLSSLQSQPRAPETKGNIQHRAAQPKSGAMTVYEGVEREAADHKTWSRALC